MTPFLIEIEFETLTEAYCQGPAAVSKLCVQNYYRFLPPFRYESRASGGRTFAGPHAVISAMVEETAVGALCRTYGLSGEPCDLETFQERMRQAHELDAKRTQALAGSQPPTA